MSAQPTTIMASATSTPADPSGRTSRSAGRSAGRSASRRSAEAGTNPTFQGHVQEKEALRDLNDRLANYIQRVQQLEGERSSMLLELGEREESKSQEMGYVRRLYEEELADVRKSLDELAGEKARLQIDHGNLCDEYRKLQSRTQKREADLAQALAQWRKVEATLNSKDAEHTKLLSENKSLSDDFTELQGHLENVEGALADTKSQLTTEILRRVEMENQVQTLKEQLELQRNISDQEILSIRSRQESRLMEMDSGRRREFESKLTESLQQLRQDHESQLQQYQDHMEKTFSSKLQTAQQVASEKNNSASITKDELEHANLRVESLSSQLEQCRKEKMVQEVHCHELERSLDKEREGWKQKLSLKEQEMVSMRSQMFSQLEEYESLLNIKLALDMEINAYRKMLEVEEQRLHLSPSPSQRTAIPRTQEHSGRKLKGKKRKHEGASGSSPAYKMSSRSTTRGAVSVAEVDMNGRYVRLKNNSETEQPLGGWVVRRTYPESGNLSFQIPPACVLAGGQTLTIWAAGGEAEADSGDLILEGHRSMGPVPEIRVILLNKDHEEIAERRVSLQAGGDTETELEFDEDIVAGSDIQHFQRRPKKKKCCSVS